VQVYPPEEAAERHAALVSSGLLPPVEQPAPPSMTTDLLQLHALHVASPSAFWVLQGAAGQPAVLREVLASAAGRLDRVLAAGQLVRDRLYLVPGGEGDYRRALVESVLGNTVTVFLVDHGSVARVEAGQLLEVSPELLPEVTAMPGLALECRLAGLQPSSVRSSRGLWDPAAVQRFRGLLAEGPLTGGVYSVTKSGSHHSRFVVALERLVVRGADGEERDVGAVLLQEGHAEEAAESHCSQQDHKDRRNFSAYHDSMQEYLDGYAQRGAVTARPLAAGSADRGRMSVRVPLAGPFSPLEHKVHGLARVMASKRANIVNDSVNAVLLDQSPSDSHDHYLVAAHVGMNPSGEALQLRNTTWLPARPGLGALATMMFSPCVEMRTDANRTRLTGCLSGLGPGVPPAEPGARPGRTEAFYPEHDIETRFDVNVTNQDVNTINKIRYWINQCLSRTEPDEMMRLTQPATLGKAQHGIKNNLEDLFGRERRREEKEALPSRREYRWGLVREQHRMPTDSRNQEAVFKVGLGLL
jgi:ATP-dependent RNA helicase TDRD9